MPHIFTHFFYLLTLSSSSASVNRLCSIGLCYVLSILWNKKKSIYAWNLRHIFDNWPFWIIYLDNHHIKKYRTKISRKCYHFHCKFCNTTQWCSITKFTMTYRLRGVSKIQNKNGTIFAPALYVSLLTAFLFSTPSFKHSLTGLSASFYSSTSIMWITKMITGVVQYANLLARSRRYVSLNAAGSRETSQ